MKIERVEVTWVDSCEFGGWESLEEGRTHIPGKAVTMGFLLEDAPDHINIVQTIGAIGGIMGVLTIPRGCVQEIQSLGEVEVECDGNPPEAP